MIQNVLAVDLHGLGAGPFAEQYPVARFEFERDQLADLVRERQAPRR